MRRVAMLTVAAVAAVSSMASAAVPSLTTMSSFGNGDGWRAPNEIVSGDFAGTATGSNYNYLGTANLERGMALNRSTGKLVVVSRSAAGNGLRILDGMTGADTGSLAQGTGIISQGTFTTNTVSVADDGAIYVSNLASPITATVPHKIYRWSSESAAAPVLAASSNVVSGGRMGDTIDAIGSGTSTRIVVGESNAAGVGTRNGYAVLNTADGASYTHSLVTFGGTPPNAGDFRLGITWAGSEVWGKQTGASAVAAPLRRSSFSGTSGTLAGSSTLFTGSEAPLDYVVIEGIPYLAVMTTNTAGTADLSVLRIYNMANPATPVLVAGAENTTGTLTANGNATGAAAFGNYDPILRRVAVYGMSSNQGIQAFYFNIPEPTTLAAIAGLGMIALRRRK
jgi:hypothetical protein